jgi:hypothetical protein
VLLLDEADVYLQRRDGLTLGPFSWSLPVIIVLAFREWMIEFLMEKTLRACCRTSVERSGDRVLIQSVFEYFEAENFGRAIRRHSVPFFSPGA